MAHTTITQRQLCYERHQHGHTYAAIAEQLGLSVPCVRYWASQQRDGRRDLSTQYQRPAKSLLHHFVPLVRYVILRLRLHHPGWGPNRIRFALTHQPTCRPQRETAAEFSSNWAISAPMAPISATALTPNAWGTSEATSVCSSLLATGF